MAGPICTGPLAAESLHANREFRVISNATRTPLEPWCIAIIDDSLEDRAEMRCMLLTASQRHLTFIEAETGAAGIAAVLNASAPPNCILLDYKLPDMEAPDVLAALVGKDGMVVCPVVVVAGGACHAEGRQALRSGAQDYVGKDWMNAQGISRAIENASESFAMTRELRERKETSRRVADRDAFRLAFTEATRNLGDPVAVKTVASRLLGLYLRVNRVVYAEVVKDGNVLIEPGYVDGVNQIEGVFALTDYGNELLLQLQQGAAIVASDLVHDSSYSSSERQAYAKLAVVANLSVPLLKDGRLVAILAVHQNSTRDWTADDIALVTEIAERTWSLLGQARAEKALLASQTKLAEIIQIMPSFSAVLRGPQHVFELANQPYYDMIGHGPEIIGKTVLEALPEIADQPFPALLDKVFNTGEAFEAHAMLARLPRGPGGRLMDIFVDFAYLPLREPNGRVSGIFVHGVDRTDQVMATRGLAQRERELRHLADNTPDVLTRFDRQLRHVFVNSAIEKITDRKVEELLGKTNRELGMPPHLCDQWDAAVNHVLDHGNHSSLEFEWPTPNDGLRHYACRLVPEFNEQGRVEFVLAVTHDITHRKAFEQQLNEQARRKDEFLATLAHELRNPLAPIRTGLQVLKRAPDGPAAARTLAVMERQLAQMVRLIDDLLDISRITTGKIVLRREKVSLQDVAASAVEASRPAIDAAGHTLILDWPAEPVWLDADPTRLAQVLSNLLTNAAKYTPANGKIRLSARRKEGDVSISVSDTGMGIPPDMLVNVFDMFTQVNRTLDRAQGGVGIGLSLVRQLVALHGGTVTASSAGIDQGSAFTVTLPVAAAPEPSVVDQPPVAAAVTEDSRRILVVDDNVDAAETMAMMLELGGYGVRTAFSGPEAIEVALSYQPDVIFLDIGLPGMNGYEVAQKLRANPLTEAARLIALTGWGTNDDQRRSERAGFDAHVTKPVEPDQIDRVLAKHRPA
jgi:PAS domain S-box-containing protein